MRWVISAAHGATRGGQANVASDAAAAALDAANLLAQGLWALAASAPGVRLAPSSRTVLYTASAAAVATTLEGIADERCALLARTLRQLLHDFANAGQRPGGGH